MSFPADVAARQNARPETSPTPRDPKTKAALAGGLFGGRADLVLRLV